MATADGMTVSLNPNSDFFAGELIQVSSTSAVQGTSPGVPRVWEFRTATGGNGEFTESGQVLGDPTQQITSTDAVLGDIDGDGDLDSFVTNTGAAIRSANRVYLNDGTGVFVDSGQALQCNG